MLTFDKPAPSLADIRRAITRDLFEGGYPYTTSIWIDTEVTDDGNTVEFTFRNLSSEFHSYGDEAIAVIRENISRFFTYDKKDGRATPVCLADMSKLTVAVKFDTEENGDKHSNVYVAADRMKKPGVFVVIEGIDGCGKGSVMEVLRKKYPDAHFTRCPGGSKVGESVRDLCKSGDMSPLSQLYAYTLGDLDNWATNIKAAIAEGKLVISDRFVESLFAYQALPNGLVREATEVIENYAKHHRPPFVDLSIYLRITEEVSMARTRAEAKQDDRYAGFSLEQMAEVRSYYDMIYMDGAKTGLRTKMMATHGSACKLDVIHCAGMTIEHLADTVIDMIDKLLENRN